MKNVNSFSTANKLKHRDVRRIQFRKQRKERGFDDTELYSLKRTIILFTLPRLKAFIPFTKSHPFYLTEDEWTKILTKMVDGLERYLIDPDDEIAREGLDLFYKYFEDLWS